MAPGIELAEGIEQAQILVIINAFHVFADGTAQRYDAQLPCPFGGKGLNRIVDLQCAFAVPDQQAKGRYAKFEQGMKHVR